MQGTYGGLICILMYAGLDAAVDEELALITENNIFILTESSQNILVQE
jgi:hypothetical protein